MRAGRFSEEQMVAIIRDPVAAVAKRHGISERTIYTWRKRFLSCAVQRAGVRVQSTAVMDRQCRADTLCDELNLSE
jgi:transposase-like protein